MNAKAILNATLVALAALLAAACQPPPEDHGAVPLESVELGFLLSSYARDASTADATGEATLEGGLLVVSHETGEEQRFQWAIRINETTLDVPTVVNLGLEKGVYDLYVVIDAAGQQYGGKLEGWVILEGENLLPVTLYPVMATSDARLSELQQMLTYKFPYSYETVSAYAAPRFGISVDGAPERTYALNLNLWLSELSSFFPNGEYLVDYRFFDADAAPPPPEPPPPPAGAEPIRVSAYRVMEPRQYGASEVTLAGATTVRIPMPEEIVVKAGNPDRYELRLYLGNVTCHYQGIQTGRDGHDSGRGRYANDLRICGAEQPMAGEPLTIDGSVSAEIVTGDPHFDRTEIEVSIEVLQTP